MTSELEEIFVELINSTEKGSDCPLCEKGVLRYTPSPFLWAIVFQCDSCKAYLRWDQLSFSEKETVVNNELKRLVRNLTEKQRKRFLKKLGLYA